LLDELIVELDLIGFLDWDLLADLLELLNTGCI